MKKIVFLSVFSLLLLFTGTVEAQRFAYVNTDYILSKMNEFNDAQRQIDAIAKGWEADIEKKQSAIEAMYTDYDRNQVLLTDEMRKKKENEILEKERDLKAYHKAKFGFEGELFKKRQELIKPVQDRVFEAIEKIAKSRGYDFIFDRSNGVTVLFADAKYDKSDDVLKYMGY